MPVEHAWEATDISVGAGLNERACNAIFWYYRFGVGRCETKGDGGKYDGPRSTTHTF
jgi:hypothetical protein